MRYREAGVDVARGEAVKQAIARAVRGTWGRAVRPLPGGFAGVMGWPGRPTATGEGELLLAATMDGVGTKLHLALDADRVADAAADLVFHSANDLLVHGARPLAFLDYVAQARLEPRVVQAAVEGLCRGCVRVGAVLLGGETAELPDTYAPEVVDVAGCMLGTVARAELLDGSAIRPGDALLGIGSDGLHTNGYSLARRVLERSGLGLGEWLPGGSGERVGEALLAPHRWYGPALRPLLEQRRVKALAHVTGGGIAGNLVRVLPEDCRARVRVGSWPRPTVFGWLIQAGEVPEDDARQTFNLGVGMVVVCAPAEREGLAAELGRAGERVFVIGEVAGGDRAVEWVDDPHGSA